MGVLYLDRGVLGYDHFGAIFLDRPVVDVFLFPLLLCSMSSADSEGLGGLIVECFVLYLLFYELESLVLSSISLTTVYVDLYPC